jgi:hypothetical protein
MSQLTYFKVQALRVDDIKKQAAIARGQVTNHADRKRGIGIMERQSIINFTGIEFNIDNNTQA